MYVTYSCFPSQIPLTISSPIQERFTLGRELNKVNSDQYIVPDICLCDDYLLGLPDFSEK